MRQAPPFRSPTICSPLVGLLCPSASIPVRAPASVPLQSGLGSSQSPAPQRVRAQSWEWSSPAVRKSVVRVVSHASRRATSARIPRMFRGGRNRNSSRYAPDNSCLGTKAQNQQRPIFLAVSGRE